MKKKNILLISILVLLAILFVPIPSQVYKDGGTWVYSSLTYKIVKWIRLFNQNEATSSDEVSIVIQTFSNKGITYILNNETDTEYTYGADFKLSVFKDNQWTDVPYIIDNFAFTLVGYILKPKSLTKMYEIDWVEIYGELPDGKYKFEKSLSSVGNSDEYVGTTVSDEFELVNGKAVEFESYTLSKLDRNNDMLNPKSFSNETDIKIIRNAYLNALTKSTLVDVDLAKLDDFYGVEATYTNGETTSFVFCSDSKNSYMIYGKNYEDLKLQQLAMPVENELYQKVIDLLS